MLINLLGLYVLSSSSSPSPSFFDLFFFSSTQNKRRADKQTGLTVQQVRSQVAGGGRANLRKQLMDLAMAL
jgi:hypothetical protein